MGGCDAAHDRHLLDVCTALMGTPQSIPHPVIAQIRGATAVGCRLVATRDRQVAAGDARFATPGVKIGLSCSTPVVALSRAVGRKRALAVAIGADGDRLLAALRDPATSPLRRALEAMGVLRRIWVQQVYPGEGQVHRLADDNLAPAGAGGSRTPPWPRMAPPMTNAVAGGERQLTRGQMAWVLTAGRSQLDEHTCAA